ncbi:crossover junction endonuclease MUS81 isoform X2 [Brachypodium distachyon]|uniref:Crossover junction endonuclease MUS81 n=1 Tax=Brachypodium distachyon TaxID=15368 RepID=A0A2K2DH48_BRADI|nr:crossover junction endonuclease MUS81 isoform X2 [Brachypodium distachyon]PNT73601.1 hypothetical protein BRADI_2g60755v3 [Brachypodium distachyon]PNT73602.1 hypothetical protein BRADI_2g60755v3 [Brachypodium distachyon]|eukprot:XP_010232819.1 crossover junction endonuclease MUS81 isoform X2 [Brachypodium distachyon]
MKDSFPGSIPGKKRRRTKCYVPQKNSASYAILITLYRTNPGCSQNDYYTGWSCMKTLLSNALVVKWSNPAKYRLTEEVEKLLSIVSARSGSAAKEISLSDSDSDSDSDELHEGNKPLIG